MIKFILGAMTGATLAVLFMSYFYIARDWDD